MMHFHINFIFRRAWYRFKRLFASVFYGRLKIGYERVGFDNSFSVNC